MLQTILDMLYPVRCPVCGEIAVPKEDKICTSCSNKLLLIIEPRCKKCGKPIEFEEKEYCIDCEKKDYHFVRGYALWSYDAVMKKSISDFKYNGKKEYAKFYVSELMHHYRETIQKLAPDAIVPVPIHKDKYRERGYNQADILARLIAREVQVPVLSHLLTRDKKTLPQKQLSDKERLRNLRKAFGYNLKVSEKFRGKLESVLLVDDIYTTGSTMEACTSVLMSYDIKKVYFIALAIGKGF